MANEPFGETVGTKIARMEEKQDRMEEKQDSMLSKMDKLIDHVNHQNEKMSLRIDCCEDYIKVKKSEQNGQIKVYKVAVALLSLTISILSIAHYFGLI